MTTVVFGDVVAVLLGTIHDTLPITTGSRVPNPRPDEFVIARRIGGDRMTPVTEITTVFFECWSSTPADADDLAAAVRRVIFALAPPGTWAGSVIDGLSIARIDDVGGPAYQPDELSDQPRATFTVSVTVRGQIQEESD